MNMATDHVSRQAFTRSELKRVLRSWPAQGTKAYPEWVCQFFTRVFFLRVMWSLRKRDCEKYRKILDQDWLAITGPWARYRKEWRKYMSMKKEGNHGTRKNQ